MHAVARMLRRYGLAETLIRLWDPAITDDVRDRELCSQVIARSSSSQEEYDRAACRGYVGTNLVSLNMRAADQPPLYTL